MKLKMTVVSVCFSAILGLFMVSNAMAEKASLRAVYRDIGDQRWAGAIKKLEVILHQDPQHADAWYYYINALTQNKQYKKAHEANKKLAKFEGYNQYALFYSATIYGLQGNDDKALHYIEAANQAGYTNYDKLKSDKAFSALRANGKIDFAPEQNYQTLTAHNGVKIPYVVLLPQHYRASNSYKVLLAYPDGSGGKASADWAVANLWQGHQQYKDWIVVVPVAPEDGWINHPSHHALNDLMKQLRKDYKVEGGQFHALGYRSGSRPAATFSQMSSSYFASLTTVGGYAWENWSERNLKGFGDKPVTLLVAKSDSAGVTINKQTSQYIKQGKTSIEYIEVENDSPRLESLYHSKLLAMMK